MAWDGSGTYTRTNGTNTGATTWADDASAGTKITASNHDTHDEDIATAINACLTKNNETKPTADFRPNVDNTYDLGSTSLRWVDLHLSGTVLPEGDTTAGDKSALGYTAAEGAILTGQGSTNDITLKNDADAEVLGVPTGTTIAELKGGLVLNERADHEATPGAAKGEIWSKSDAPNTLYFTDDDGTDHQIGPKLVLGTEADLTNGGADNLTVYDFTGIPSWAQKITLTITGWSGNGNDYHMIQLGDAGGIEATGYTSSASKLSTAVDTQTSTVGFRINTNSADDALDGTIVLTLEDAANNTWSVFGNLADPGNSELQIIAGTKSLSATLTQIRLTTVNGTDVFDGGAANILYE